MNFSKKQRNNKKIILDITPLIDVVFLLIIFFMLTSSFILQPGIKVNLPSAQSAHTQSSKDIIITMTNTGQLFLNDEKVLVSELQIRLEKLLNHSNKKFVIIKADRDTLHGFVVRVLDIAKSAGAERLAIATTPETIKGK